MRPCLFAIILLGLLGTLGCEEYRAVVSPPKSDSKKTAAPLVKRVESPDLAKFILKPVREKIDVTRDPFRPLPIVQSSEKAKDTLTEQPDLADWKLVGVVKMDAEFVALLKSKNRRGVFRVNDKIQNYTVISIDEKQVIFNNGSSKIIMKRGDIK